MHNEAMRHVQNDYRRAIGVARELFDPNSGESKFSTGNKDTLAGATPEKVRAFYESQYTAERMALAIAGKGSLDELEKMAREMFAAIPRRNKWADVNAFAKRFFAKGRLEALAHGHISADDAIAVTRAFAKHIGATAVAKTELLRRRHTDIARNENVIDAGKIEGVNSVYLGDYLLADNLPKTRAAAVVLGNFISEPFFTELRTKQQLGYRVGAGFGASRNQRFVSFAVQSSAYAPDELRRRAEAFIKTQPAALAAISDLQWTTLVSGARSNLEQLPKSIAEKANYFFALAYDFERDWERREATLPALDALTKSEAAALLTTVLADDGARRRTVLLHRLPH